MERWAWSSTPSSGRWKPPTPTATPAIAGSSSVSDACFRGCTAQLGRNSGGEILAGFATIFLRHSSRIVQTGGDSIHGRSDGVVQLLSLFPAALSPQQFNLDQAHGIDVGIAEPDRAGKHGIALQELLLASDQKNHAPGAMKLFRQHLVHGLPQTSIVNQRCIQLRDGEVCLGHSNLDIAN